MIWRPRHLTRTQREERRLEAARLLQAGRLSQAEIARRMGVSRMAISQWAKQLRQHPDDLASLECRPRPGRPSRLTAGQWPHVRQRLTQGALQAGFETERWTLPCIRALIAVEFGVHYPAHYLARRLKALGWSPQEPAVYARERDEALVQAWPTRDWPESCRECLFQIQTDVRRRVTGEAGCVPGSGSLARLRVAQSDAGAGSSVVLSG